MIRTSMLFTLMGLLGSLAFAGDHQIPTAPQDYLDKKNPLEATKVVLEKGAKVYERKCKKCHGDQGDGKGSNAKGLSTPATAFVTAGYMKDRKDGQLFWIIEKGSKDTDMEAYGPGSDANLSNDDMWAVIAYMRAQFTK